MREIEDKEAEHEPDDDGDPVCAAEKILIDAIEGVPYAPPDKDEPECDRHVLSQVLDRVFLKVAAFHARIISL